MFQKCLSLKNVLEVGCGDGWYSKIVAQTVKKLTISDNDPIFIRNMKENKKIRNIKIILHDMIKRPTSKNLREYIY